MAVTAEDIISKYYTSYQAPDLICFLDRCGFMADMSTSTD